MHSRHPRMKGRSLRRAIILTFVAILALVVAPQLWVYSRYNGSVYDQPSEIPPAPVAIVFGAGLRPDGQPSNMLAERVDAAVELYKAGKVERLLMTGDSQSANHDEVTAMRRRAVAQGVPAERIDLDRAGLSTYDSSYRARTVFGIAEAILVSQRYHLPRALYYANSFGIKATGLKAGSDRYPGQVYYSLREVAGLTIAWYEVNLIRHGPAT